MLKFALLAGAMVIPGTALAQTTAAPAAPATTPPVPAQTSAAAPTTSTSQVQPAVPTAAPVPPRSAPAPAADPAAQVATIVDAEFASYDKDGNGALSKEEFATWMGKLKAASPTAAAPKADPTAEAKWNDAAFAQADADKSKALSKEELTGFLSQSAKTAA